MRIFRKLQFLPKKELHLFSVQNNIEVNYKEELQKGSEKLRKEAAQNLQKFGGNFMFDFYRGNAKIDYSSRNGGTDQVSNFKVKILTILESSRNGQWSSWKT